MWLENNGGNRVLYSIFILNKTGEAENGNLIYEKGSWIMVPRESGTHLQRQKQTEIMIFWAICSIASFHLLKAAREIVIQKSIMIDKDQSSF